MNGDSDSDSQGEFGADAEGNLGGSPAEAQAEAATAPEASVAETEAAINESAVSGLLGETTDQGLTITSNGLSMAASIAGLLGLGPIGLGLGLAGKGLSAFGGGSFSLPSGSPTPSAASTGSDAFNFLDSQTMQDPLEELRTNYLRYTQNRQGT